jgi:hypothetical protein
MIMAESLKRPLIRSAFVSIPKRPNGRLDRGRLKAAVSRGFRIVRWHLENGAKT